MLDFVGYGSSFLSNTMEHPIQDLIFYFMIYCFIGWNIEGLYALVTTGSFFKDNFLIGPFKPMYAFAPIILLFSANPNSSIGFLILLSFVIPSLVELISGMILKDYFGKRWWDYSDFRFNIKGHVCLTFSIYWIGLCFLLIYFVHPMIYSFYQKIYPFWSSIYLAVLLYFVGDFLYTVFTRRRAYRKASTI